VAVGEDSKVGEEECHQEADEASQRTRRWRREIRREDGVV